MKPKVYTKKPNAKNLKKKLWELCKQITRERFKREDGKWNCYTCDRLIDEPRKAHTAHLIPSGSCGAFLRYDFRNLRICDYYCNINLGGNGAEYYRRMVMEVGQSSVDQLFKDKQKVIKADVIYYQSKINEYEEIIKRIHEEARK